MKLLLDIGNTRIKAALLLADGLTQHHALAHAGLSVAQLKAQLLARYQTVTAVWVANVAGAAMADRIKQAVHEQWQFEPVFAATTARFGAVINAYPQPEKLGVDRWLSLLATHAMQLQTSVLIVSVGTAMTIDVLSASGEHQGGMIIPGPDLMINSLLQNTSDIAAFATSGEATDEFFADNTLGAIHQGATHACAALIEAAYRKLAINESLKVLITGGAAWRITPVLGVPVQEVSDLVLRGLGVMATS